jgi:hypothetical protein
MLTANNPVLSRHRLPQPYRLLLVVFWLLPLGMLTLTAFIGSRSLAFDVRLLLMLGLMALPAWYIWQEGVDVLPGGIRVRVYVPRCYAYDDLKAWRVTTWKQSRILTIWTQERGKALECHAAHLTDWPRLVRSLRENVPGSGGLG